MYVFSLLRVQSSRRGKTPRMRGQPRPTRICRGKHKLHWKKSGVWNARLGKRNNCARNKSASSKSRNTELNRSWMPSSWDDVATCAAGLVGDKLCLIYLLLAFWCCWWFAMLPMHDSDRLALVNSWWAQAYGGQFMIVTYLLLSNHDSDKLVVVSSC